MVPPSSSKDQDKAHPNHFAAATGQEGLTPAADLGWIRAGKVKAEGLQRCSVLPLRETVRVFHSLWLESRREHFGDTRP